MVLYKKPFDILIHFQLLSKIKHCNNSTISIETLLQAFQESELTSSSQKFTEKFDDVEKRKRVLEHDNRQFIAEISRLQREIMEINYESTESLKQQEVQLGELQSHLDEKMMEVMEKDSIISELEQQVETMEADVTDKTKV